MCMMTGTLGSILGLQITNFPFDNLHRMQPVHVGFTCSFISVDLHGLLFALLHGGSVRKSSVLRCSCRSAHAIGRGRGVVREGQSWRNGQKGRGREIGNLNYRETGGRRVPLCCPSTHAVAPLPPPPAPGAVPLPYYRAPRALPKNIPCHPSPPRWTQPSDAMSPLALLPF